MKVIDYEKYAKKWSPRGTVTLLVVEALSTGFFLGLALMEGLYTHKVSNWAWPLVLAFSGAAGTLQATLIALHYCSSAKAQRSEQASN